MNPDFVEMLSALSDAGAEFLVIGAHAVAVHARPRATGDLDLWVRPTEENARRVWRALTAFGAPLHELDLEDVVSDDLVFQIGVAPNRIELLTDVGGLGFEEAWDRHVRVEVGTVSVPVPVIGKEDLITTKRAAGRPRDLADIAALEGRA